MFVENPYYKGIDLPPGIGVEFDLAIVVVLASAVAVLAYRFRFSPAKRKTNYTRTKSRPNIPWQSDNLASPTAQLEAIAQTGFTTVPILNKSEKRIYPALEDCVAQFGEGHRLMAQTSLGELLRPTGNHVAKRTRDRAYASINSKRLDFAVIDRYGHLVVALEYQGHGHYHQTSFMRDAVKREVMRKAAVTFVELMANVTPQDAAATLRTALETRKAMR